MPDYIQELLSLARGGNAEQPKATDQPVLVGIAPEQRRSLRYNSPELDEYSSFVERRNGLPEGLIKAIKNAGERSNSNQVSPKGAQGVMQFIPGTWKQYGKDADPTDPVASIDAAGAYFKDLLQRYNGNVDAAVTEYNGGVKQAQTVAGGGRPWVPETVAYLARIRQALGQNDQGQPQRKPVPVMADPSIQPSRNLGEEEREEARRRREYEEQGAFTRGLGVVVPQMKQAAGAGLALFGSKTGNKELQQSGLDIYQNASKEAEKFDDPSASLSNVLDGKGSFSDFSKYWAGNGIGQVVESAITGLASAAVGGAAGSVVPGAGTAAGTVSGFVGGIIGKGAVKKALAEGAENLLAKEVQAGIARGLTREAAEAAAAPVVKTWVAAETKKAGVRALAAAGAATGLYAQNTGMELGEIYGHYIDEMVRSGRPITPEDEDLAMKSAMSAAGVETVADALGLGRLLGTAKDAATKGFVRNVAKEVALGVGREVPTEVAQTAVERFGKNQPLDNAEAVRDYVDAAGGAAVPGAMFGAGAGVKRTLSPNSPLSNAATAAGGMAGPTVQPTPATPGAPSSGAAGATSPGQGAQAPADPISEKVEALRPFLEDKELVRAIRNLPELGPESVNELLAAWALARNPNTNPNVRASLLDQIGQFVDSVQNRPNWTFGKQAQPEAGQEGAPNVPTVPGQSQSPRAVEAPRLTDDGLTLDGEARELPPAQLNAPPKPALETEGALRDRAQAMAEYEQAFQDLVKAEQLGASDAELQQKQQDLREAEAFKKQAEARLQEIRETIEGNRQLETERKRNAVLDAVLADAETANPAERFAADLKRQGFSETIPTPGELARIARFEDIKAAEREPQQAPDALPSAPNEFDPYEQRKERQNVSKKPGATNAAVGEKRTQGGRDVAPRGQGAPGGAPNGGGNRSGLPASAGVDAPVVQSAQSVRDSGGEQAPAVTAKRPEESATEKTHREWRENYDRVQADPAAASTKDLYRAASYANSVMRGVTRSAQVGSEDSPALRKAMAEEHDFLMSEWKKRPDRFESEAQPSTNGGKNERNDQPPAESRGAAAASPAESQGVALPRPAGPWSAEELNERGLVEDANNYLNMRDRGGVIMTGAINATIADREKALGLPLPGVGGRDGLPASLAVTYDKSEYGESAFAEVFRAEFGGEALEISIADKPLSDEQIVGVPPLVLKRGENDEIYGFRVDGLPGDLFDFVDAVEQAYAQLAERASRSPKGQQIDDQVAAQLEGRDEPTDAQKEAENYQKAHVSVLGLEISVETEKGDQRTGKDKDGGEWSVTMPAHYGYIKGTRGADKDHLDIFLGPKPDNGQFYIVNQNQPDSSKFDEHKVMLGYDSAEAAQADYLLSFSDAFGGRVFGSVAGPFSLDEFKAMLPDLAKPKPVKAKGAEVADVKLADAAPEFTTLKDRDGRTVTVRTTDLNGERDRLPMFTKDGKRKPGVIHRDNLDPTGEKLAGQAEEDAKNPLFDIITTKNGETFAAAGAAEREIYRRGLQATHEAVPAEDVRPGLPGYLIRRIAGNNKDSAPLQVESSDKNASKNNSDQPAAAPQEVESSSAGSLAPDVKSFKHTKTGETIYSVTMPVQVSREDYQAINRAAVRNGGRWSSFKGPGVIPGFHFKSEEKAKAFAADSAVTGVLANYGSKQHEGSKQPAPSEASAAPEATKVEPDADLIAIFEGMDSGGLAKNRAEKAAAEHPMAENIRAVDDGFHDMLMSLMDAGILEVNGQKTITEDNKKCV